MKTVNVVAAIILRDGRIFATQRGYGKFKDLWEFPGGKIEKDETPVQALEREIQEELEIRIGIRQEIATVDYDYSDFHLHMHCFLCSIDKEQPKLTEHEDARWLLPEELDSVTWLEADKELVATLKEMRF